MAGSTGDPAGERTEHGRSDEPRSRGAAVEADTGHSGHEDPTVVPDGGTAAGHGAGTAGGGTQYCNNCGASVAANAELCPQCGVRLQDETADGEEPSGRWKAAILGGVASFFLGWVPIVGPAIGGVLAGYMRGSDTKESAITGALANLLASIPSILLVGLFFMLGAIGAGADPAMGGGELAAGLFVWLLIFLVGFLYFWGFGAIGGAIGASMSDKRAPE